MIWKATILLNYVLCVLGNEHHATSEQRISIKHEEHSKDPHGHYNKTDVDPNEPENHEEYASSHPSYEFSYKVRDPHTHDIKGQHETRNGDEVKGEYWLIEPDYRKRIITYHADKHSGFHATVHFSDDHHHEHKKNEASIKKEISHQNDENSYQQKQEDEEKKEDEPAPVKEEGQEDEKHEESSLEKKDQTESLEIKGYQSKDKEIDKWIHNHHWGRHGEAKDGIYKFSKENKYDGYNLDREHRHNEENKVMGTGLFINMNNQGELNSNKHVEYHEHQKEEENEVSLAAKERQKDVKQGEENQENGVQEKEEQKDEEQDKDEGQQENIDTEQNDRKKEIAKWSHDRHWQIHGKEKHFVENKYDHRDLTRNDGWQKRNENHKNIGRAIFNKKGGHGNNGKEGQGFGNKLNREENSNVERREDTAARPSFQLGTIIRENYYNPRFNRQNINH